MKKPTSKTILPEDSRAGDGRAACSWLGKIFGHFLLKKEVFIMNEMGKKYGKEIKDGKEVYSMLNDNGEPLREVKTIDWELESYINYCLFPILNLIKRMEEKIDQEDRSEINEFADILDRLYDAAAVQLEKMNDIIDKDMGIILIRTTHEDCFGGFMQQDFLEALVEKKQDTNRA